MASAGLGCPRVGWGTSGCRCCLDSHDGSHRPPGAKSSASSSPLLLSSISSCIAGGWFRCQCSPCRRWWGRACCCCAWRAGGDQLKEFEPSAPALTEGGRVRELPKRPASQLEAPGGLVTGCCGPPHTGCPAALHTPAPESSARLRARALHKASCESKHASACGTPRNVHGTGPGSQPSAVACRPSAQPSRPRHAVW
eukprot:scaffold4145_cov115-Isochrysis_galbana.AAC.7